MSLTGRAIRTATRLARRWAVGPEQDWVFRAPESSWIPPVIPETSLYLHVPFCRNECPYCPYTKFPMDETLLNPYTSSAIAEVDRWAERIGPARITSIYIGGGTPTLALNSVAGILQRIRTRFDLSGDICMETSPADVRKDTVKQLKDMGVAMVSLGIQTFKPELLRSIGRKYDPAMAETALTLLKEGNFTSINTDLLFALPGQTADDLIADLAHVRDLGADQITTYPLFTFPYTPVGEYMKLKHVKMPNLTTRKEHYHTIHDWCSANDFQRISVWGFRHGNVPRYSSVTRDGYIGIGPGAGSHLPDGFVLNTFDLKSWMNAVNEQKTAAALRMRFRRELSAWWWLYWRFYDTRIPLEPLEELFGTGTPRVRRLLDTLTRLKLAAYTSTHLELLESGAFWLHLMQNHFALNYVNTLWTEARRTPWPPSVRI